MVCIIFLFLTRFYVNNARSSGNPTWCAFQSYSIMFSRQILTHVYYAFKSYVRQEGHLYEVFRILGDTSYLRTSVKGCSKIRRVLAKSRLILDEIFRLYRKFVSYLRPISHKMRLILPRIIGLLSSSKFYCKFMQICSALNLSASLPGNMPIILSHTLLCVPTSFYYGTFAINTRIMSNYL